MARGLLSCIFASILQDAAAVPIVSVGIIVCNTHGNIFSCKFSCISFGFVCFAGGGCRLSDGQRVKLAHLPPLPVAVCPLFGPEHRPPGDSSSLPSPPLFSSGQCSPLVVSVLLRCSPASCVLLGGFGARFCSAGVVIYGDIFFLYSTAPGINARARVRAGGGLSRFFALCGAADGVFLWGSVSGHSLNARNAWRGVSVRFLYLRGHCQKSARA